MTGGYGGVGSKGRGTGSKHDRWVSRRVFEALVILLFGPQMLCLVGLFMMKLAYLIPQMLCLVGLFIMKLAYLIPNLSSIQLLR